MTDELTFLRQLEQTVQDGLRTDKWSEVRTCIATARSEISRRIIEVLEERVGQQELHDMAAAEETPDFAEGADSL